MHAKSVVSTPAKAFRGAVSWPVNFGPSPSLIGTMSPVGVVTVEANVWELFEAPTVISDATSPGVLIVFGPYWPSFPAGTTTVIPPSMAFAIAPAQGSQYTPAPALQTAPRSAGD